MPLSTVTFMKASPAVFATAVVGAAAAASAAGAPEVCGEPAAGGPPGGGAVVCARDTHGAAIASAKLAASAIAAQLRAPALRFRRIAFTTSPPIGLSRSVPLALDSDRVLQPRYWRNRACGLFARARPIAIIHVADWA